MIRAIILRVDIWRALKKRRANRKPLSASHIQGHRTRRLRFVETALGMRKAVGL